MRMAVGRVWVRVIFLALLPVDCSADGRMSNEKTHGIRTVSSGQDTKADHGTTIASQEASDPNALRSGHEGEEPRQEEADAHVRVPALRLIQGDAHQWSVSRHPGQRVPDRTDRTSIGLCATGRRQDRRERDARARERLDDSGGLELLGLPLLPIMGLPNRWVTDCS